MAALQEIHLVLGFIALFVHGNSSPNHENVIDLLAALNMSHHVSGVTRLQSSSSTVYKIRPRAPYLTLPREYSHFLYSNLQGSIGVNLVGHQVSGSSATVFSLSSASSPILQIISSNLNQSLRLDYQAEGRSQGLASVHFPGRNPFSREEWVQLAVSLEPDRLTFFVDCQEAAVLPIKHENRINLKLPQDVVISLASTPGKKDSKFSGYFKTAEISLKAYQRRPWICGNITDTPSEDTLSPDSGTDIHQILHRDSSPSKHQKNHRLQDQTNNHLLDIQSDQLQRGAVLGPPGSPQGVKSDSQAQREDRLRKMERRLEDMARMLDMVKAQNIDLQSRVKHLEGCECVRQRCVYEGREMVDGQRWQTDINTLCSCTSGRVTCQANIQTDDPCLSNPCQNGGTCFVLASDPAEFHCSCPANTKGPVCQRQHRKACWVPKPENSCEGVRSFRHRWAFNPTTGLCEDFLYCTGNSSNSFPSFNACRDQCMLGACCLRKPRKAHPTSQLHYIQDDYNISYVNRTPFGNGKLDLEDEMWYSNAEFNHTEQEDLKGSRKRTDCRKDPGFTYTCDYLTVAQCQALAKDQAGEPQVVSYSPGVKCSDMRCGGGCGRFSQRKLRRYRERFRQGCGDSVCTQSSRGNCMCRHLMQRKEIRYLTLRERRLYQRAIRKLYTRPALWKSFALLRAEFSPTAGDHAFFLPWHRYFLRLVEYELQSLSSCKLAIPYFEWTVDSGSMESSAAWQAGLFGGDGEADSGCIPHHPFQGLASHFHWIPCLKRNFNSSIWLPDAVTLQRAINQADFQVFSQSLQTFSGLFRLWVGGHMASPLAAYDPLYLSHMAFMDKLWQQWQEKHQISSKRQTFRDDHYKSNILYPASRRYVKMSPFDVTPDDVIAFQQQPCTVYVPITIGAPCNVTYFQTHPQGSPKYQMRSSDKHNSNSSVTGGFDSRGFDQHGYDHNGYDWSGWDRWGYGKDGFNLDFIDRDGYDVFGFNRYGFNRSNVTWFGMHRDGVFVDKRTEKHNGDRTYRKTHRDNTVSKLFGDRGYSMYGFDPFGLDRGGFDAFGFRTDGYDKDSCNWFFNGPHYLRIYFHTQQQLMSSSHEALTRIIRTCPHIASLPQHWATQDWMTFGPGKNLNGQLEQDQEEPYKPENVDALKAAIQNGNSIWLPVTPDHRARLFCHYWKESTARCSPVAYRKGCEPDGTVHSVSHNTVDGCQTCTCKGGQRECSPQPCPTLDCLVTENVPGDCCQQCRGCHHFGVRYDHKATWRPAENPCDVCQCLEGRVRCERERCNTPCENPTAPPPNSCCPVCQGCGVKGQNFPDGAVVPATDRCQECTCVKGDVSCSPLPCPPVPCRNPVHRAGDCCPRCEQCEYESTVYINGQKFQSRTDPCLECRCTAGEVSCERMDTSCPPPQCSHPAQRKGECCPTCNECEYDRRVYADGKVFVPAGSGPCLQCRCKGGNVACRDEKCPPVQCSNPVSDPHHCCPVCKACVVEGVEYEEGSHWRPDGPCSSCTCVNGETICSQTRCPPTNCQHPTKTTGSCCAECESCTYNHRIYTNGQSFTTPDQPCHVCSCQHGSVQCQRRPCPALNCTNSHTPPGECCPRCPDCNFENRVFVNGEAFPNPVRRCEECRCESGRIDCHQLQCPQPRCNAPLPGTCCQNNCNGCSYAGKEYPNGQEFPHPTDPCRTCTCLNGNVQCLMKRCPPTPCSKPNVVQGDCCPQCPARPSDCVYEQRSYRHTERFYHPSDSCQSCGCNNGTVHCQRRPCSFARCSHPITQDCCRTCEGCLYEGRERANGETWDVPSDPCAVCVCREGSVQCERKRCPPSNCNHPVQRQCCMSCDGCMFDGKEYHDGTEFADNKDPCSVCYCYGGDVTCTKMPCNGDCSHPYKPPRQCCGECERCSYNGVVLVSGQSIPNPGNPCSECTCQSGSVRCVRKQCPPAPCPHPTANQCGCPVCDGCQFQGVTYVDGQMLPGGACQDCTCSRGEVVCEQRRCPVVSCSHPALDGCACGVCDRCSFHGRDCYNGERFPHPSDRCQQCSCLNGGVVCSHVRCPNPVCGRPVTPPGECCPVCTGMCLYQGREYQSGSTFTSPSDPCSSCSCLNEVVNCQRRPCPVQCSHPVPSDSCCPVCNSCLYEGVVHSHGQTFTPLSNPCQRCTCVRGTATCVPHVCPPTPCARPVVRPGQCCPECPVSGCMLDGQEFRDGQSWAMSPNHCSTCTCQTGEVHCASPDCPKLSCMHQVTDPGTCCPRCRGCIYGGEEHAEGSSWFADSTPCMNCMCVDGVTTCSEVRCLSPCVNFINVPGECCPVCADCVFEGRVYSPGDSFHPADDPCQICTCEVMPDGEQHLKCYRKQCPSLVDCPKSNILFSGPDSCCPVCAQPLSNCTARLIGNEVLATDDPCFTCQCKDLTWTCLHQNCPPLSCPPNEQFTPPDGCCPVCKHCVIESQNQRMINGTSWTDSDDDCITCTCKLGYIECSIEECPPAVCLSGQKQVKPPGKCCPECQDSEASCLYQGTVYPSNEQWEVDECTSCTCVSGDVHCRSERCPPLTCATDEMPAVFPGLCCPHCLPRPATCIAFGDPHYRTFDGRMLHFQGTCTYILAQDCEGGDFSIHATNDDRGRKGVSWTKEVTVFVGDVTVQLLQDWLVKVNNEVVTLPFLREPHIYIERQTNTILLNTNIGMKVLWSPRSHVEVSVPGSYKGQTCGLCGNFNNYYQDDLRMPSGRLGLSESEFGNSWRVKNSSHSLSSCRPGEDVDPCKDAGYQAKKAANNRCKILKSAAFKACHRVVPPEPWYGACVYDLCACGSKADECLCDTLEAYASQCRQAGVILKWRSTSLCAVGCPVERGFVFDECGPPCPVTCFNVDVPLGVIESHCFKPCVPGCQCPAGLVLHNSYCIQPEKCPKIIHGNST